MPEPTALLERYVANLSGDEQPYRSYVEQFLGCVEGEFDRDGLLYYVEQLAEAGYKSSTRDVRFRAVKRFWTVNEDELGKWPLTRKDKPEVAADERYAPRLLDEDVLEWIGEAKRGRWPEPVVARLCVSTIYGPRRGELAALNDPDIDLEGRTIIIRVLKKKQQRTEGAVVRRHLIPEAIIPYLEVDLRPISAQHCTRLFNELAADMGLGELVGVGWHAIRRALDHGLYVHPDLTPQKVKLFLRWASAGASNEMESIYAATQAVGRRVPVDRERMLMSPADERIDREIFAAHPFLGAWEG